MQMQMLTTNNEGFQTTTAKSAPSNNAATKAPDDDEPFNAIISTERLRSCGSGRISEERCDSGPFSPGGTELRSVLVLESACNSLVLGTIIREGHLGLCFCFLKPLSPPHEIASYEERVFNGQSAGGGDQTSSCQISLDCNQGFL